MVTIDIRIEDGDLKTMLRGLQDRVINLKPAFNIIGQTVRSSVVRNFMEGGRPTHWKPSKRAIRESGQTLLDKGRLMKSINAKAFQDHAEVGTNLVYAAIHQFGGKAGRGKKVTIPARPYLMVQDEDWPAINSALTEYILRGK